MARDTESTTIPTRRRRSVARHARRGGIVGNYVDQFDIFVPVIALAPAAQQLFGSQHLATAAGLVFVATLLGRPIGAAVLGPVSDRFGRTRTAQVALTGIAVTTLLIACIPDNRLLGPGTLLTVLALRFIGGIFLGGEYAAAIPLAMEWSAPRHRGLVSGQIMAMSPAANATIAGLTLGLLTVLGIDRYAQWGWRIPFMLGAALAVGMLVYYRRWVADAPSAEARHTPNPLGQVLTGHQGQTMARILLLMTGLWLMTNMAIPVLTANLTSDTALGPRAVSLTMLCATAVSATGMVGAGHLSTRTGRARFFIWFGTAAVLLAPAAYWAVFTAAATGWIITLVTVLQIVTVSAYGPVGAYLSEQFPAGTRSSGYGIGYSASIVLPALYPWYLPPLQQVLGPHAAVAALLALAGLLVAIGGHLGSSQDAEAPLT
jgi:MFS family permease